MKVLKRTERFIYESHVSKFIFVLAAITLFKTGLWCIPSFDKQVLMAQNPFVNPITDPMDHYIFWNWLGPFMAWTLGIKGLYSMFAFHLFFSLSFYFLFIKTAFANFSNETARSSIILFSILPVSGTSFFWVGLDSITLFLMMLSLAIPRRGIITFPIGILLGMQHFEQALFAGSGLLLALVLNKRNELLKFSVKFCLLFIMGVFFGKLVLMAIFEYYSIEVNSGRIYLFKTQFSQILESFFFHFQNIVWSILGLGWLVALKYSDMGHKTVPFFISLFGFCLVSLIALDQTRVLSIITFPLIAAFWLLNGDFLNKISKCEVSVVFITWVIMPWSWVFIGEPKWSVFPYDIIYILHKLFGWFKLPQDLYYWPFLN